MVLPDKFKEYLLEAAGASAAPIILSAIQNGTPTVSIRLNPLKPGGIVSGVGDAYCENEVGDAYCVSGVGDAYCVMKKVPEKSHNMRPQLHPHIQTRQVPWCKDGLYLSERPVFTLDPALHAGAYYVQEPSSMFLSVLEPVFKILKPQTLLDLCAAPGGKTTHLVSMLQRKSSNLSAINKYDHPSKLYANEVIKSRISSLRENMVKWGDHSVEVTSRDARDFAKLLDKASGSKILFDFILVDAPCSGEGMFRKDPSAVKEWSEESVKMCAARQKRILSDIWDSLAPGGLLAYSTCTFNKYENDQNVAWLKREYEANIFDMVDFYKSNGIEDKFNMELVKDWGILPTKEGGFQFFPGLVEGEGFFFALLQKPDLTIERDFCTDKKEKFYPNNSNKSVKSQSFQNTSFKNSGYKGKTSYNGLTELKGPDHDYALSLDYAGEWPSVELTKSEALQYLSRNVLILKDAPLGYLRVTYNGLGLGFVKNLGNRANNLYPMNWRIRMDIP